MTEQFKVTLRQQLLVAAPCYLKYIAVFIILKFVLSYDLSKPGFQWMFIVLFLVDVLPAMLLHIQYFNENRKSTFTLNKVDRTMTYQKGDKTANANFDDIVLFKYVVSYGRGKSTGWYSFGDYRYFEIGLKDGSSFIVTCLMIESIQETLEMRVRINAEKKLKVFAFIKRTSGYNAI